MAKKLMSDITEFFDENCSHISLSIHFNAKCMSRECKVFRFYIFINEVHKSLLTDKKWSECEEK